MQLKYVSNLGFALFILNAFYALIVLKKKFFFSISVLRLSVHEAFTALKIELKRWKLFSYPKIEMEKMYLSEFWWNFDQE